MTRIGVTCSWSARARQRSTPRETLVKGTVLCYFWQVTSGSSVEAFVDDLAGRGRYDFTTAEAVATLGVSEVAARAALRRLAARGRIAMPFRGFHVIVPPEYRKLGGLPPEQFVPQLMGRLELAYYVALLSAAQYHGAAHQRPQRFQVAVAKNRKPIVSGAVAVEFIARKQAALVPVQALNTPRGAVLVSSVEATALDLVGYPAHAGGLDQAATVLAELADQIDGARLAVAAKTAPVSWSQRLGYVLDFLGHQHRTAPLAAFVRENASEVVPLAPSEPTAGARRIPRWRLNVNVDVEAEV
jgi:predicted transcriptional regulator of viral defense system